MLAPLQSTLPLKANALEAILGGGLFNWGDAWPSQGVTNPSAAAARKDGMAAEKARSNWLIVAVEHPTGMLLRVWLRLIVIFPLQAS
jgi:hypothetical protein